MKCRAHILNIVLVIIAPMFGFIKTRSTAVVFRTVSVFVSLCFIHLKFQSPSASVIQNVMRMMNKRTNGKYVHHSACVGEGRSLLCT